MTSLQLSPQLVHHNDDIHFPLREIVTVLLRSKRLLAVAAIIAMAIALLAGWRIGSFKSEGYLQFRQTLPEFKQLQIAIAAPDRWLKFSKTRDTAEIAALTGIEETLSDSKRNQGLIVPIYALTKADLKNLPDAPITEINDPISALKLSFAASDPPTAQLGVQILGDFVRDTAILIRYRNSVRKDHMEYLTSPKKYDNEIIEAKYKLQQVQTKRNDMQKILQRYPEAAKAGNRQLVSIAEGGARYLSPVTQLVALESEIADLNQNLLDIMRKQRISNLHLRYSEAVFALLNQSTSGLTLLKALPGVRDALQLDLTDEVERTVYNKIAIDNIQAKALYFETTRFIAAPTLPTQRNPRLLMMALLGLLVGTLLGSAYVLVRHFAGQRHSA